MQYDIRMGVLPCRIRIFVYIIKQIDLGSPVDFGHKTYNYYGAYLRKKYDGKRVFKIIADAGFTCPNRDGSKGYGGCIPHPD